MYDELEGKIRMRAARFLDEAMSDNPQHTHSRLHSAQMAAALYTCLAARQALQEPTR